MITDTAIFAALRTFLVQDVVPRGVEVLQGQQNRVPQPAGKHYVIMSAASRAFQSSSYRDYDPPPTGEMVPGTVDISRSTGVTIQLDFYGPDSSDYAQRFATLFRDDYGYQAFAGKDVTPLYCDNGQQMPLTNAEKQYEARWMIQAVLQVNPAVSTPMQFADRVNVTIVEAD